MLFPLLVSLLASPHPVTFGFHAVQCIPVREVVCVADEDYPAPICLHDVVNAIGQVNEAVGHTVFRFAGVIQPDAIKAAYDAGQLPVFGLPLAGMPNENVLAYTAPKVEPDVDAGTACIVHVAIAVGPIVSRGVLFPTYPIIPEWVLAHELVHALGGEHADPRGHFISRMEPSYSVDSYSHFSPADIFTLRTVYGR